MADGGTVVIDIDVRYKNSTGDGPKKTAKDIDRITKSMGDADKAGEKAQGSIKKVGSALADIARKTVSIPIRILDYATRPLRGLFNFATSIRGVITGIFMGQTAQKLVEQPLALADAYSSALTGFSTLFKSQEKGQKMMNDLDEFARTTPFKTSNVINQSQKMLAMGWDPNAILKDMETIGNAASSTGKGDEGLERIVLSLAQIKAKGKLSTEELNQLAEAGINAKAYVAKGLGFGEGDQALAKLNESMQSKKNPIMGGVAVDAILKGMENDYAGMMQKLSRDTVSGLKSNIADTFEINIFRKWGQGLQDGAKKGLGAFADMLDANQDKLSRLGDTARKTAAGLSEKFAGAAEFVSQKLLDITGSARFDKADLGGKFKLLWDGMIGDPFRDWWNSKGQQQAAELAGKLGGTIGNVLKGGIMAILGIDTSGVGDAGASIGKSFAEGFLQGFEPEKVADALSKAFSGMLGSAGKLMPGGEVPDALSYLSAGVLGYGAVKIGGAVAPLASGIAGLGKAAAGSTAMSGAASTMGAGATTAAGFGIAGTAGVAGGVLGGLGLMSAFNDAVQGSQSRFSQEKAEKMWSGAAKAGMVATGAGVGAAIGSIVPVIGTAVGTLVGAGIGGLGALMGGNSAGKSLAGGDAFGDGTNRIHAASKALDEAAASYGKVREKSDLANGAMEEYAASSVKLAEALKSKADTSLIDSYKEAQEDAIQSVAGMYPELFGQYDLEYWKLTRNSEKLKEKFELIEKMTESERKSAQIQAEMAAMEFEQVRPDAEKNLASLTEEKEQHSANYSREGALATAVAEIQTRAQTEMNNTPEAQRYTDPVYQAKMQGYTDEASELARNSGYENFAFTTEDLLTGGAYNIVQRNAIKEGDAALAADTAYQAAFGEYQGGYENAVSSVMNQDIQDSSGETSSVPQVLKKIDRINELGQEISDMQEALRKARTEFLSDTSQTDTDWKASDVSIEMSKKIQESTKEQQGLQAETDKYKLTLETVVQKLADIGTLYQLIPAEKTIRIQVLEDYLHPSQRMAAPDWKTLTPEERMQTIQDRRGFAKGTNSAPSGYAWVGENGPEIVKFAGGERVFTAQQSKALMREGTTFPESSWSVAESLGSSRAGAGEPRAAQGVTVNLGGITVEVQAQGNQDLVGALRGEVEAIANDICAAASVHIKRSFGNMTREIEGLR